jgi:hypothetical protein
MLTGGGSAGSPAGRAGEGGGSTERPPQRTTAANPASTSAMQTMITHMVAV